jgi:hypothetical protein
MPGVGLARGVLELRDQFGRVAAQRLEQPLHLLRGHALLVLVEQRVVGFALVAQPLGNLAHEAHYLLQMRLEQPKVRLLARLFPDLLGEAGDARELHHQLGGQLGEFVVLASPLADVHGGHAVGRLGQLAALQLAEPLADARVGRALVDHPRQHRELVRAVRGGFRGHRYALIPAQHACD